MTSLHYPPYSFEFDIHIYDTDCYGVMWHGSYVKWLEMGRVDLFKNLNLDIKEMSDHHDIIFPVVEQTVRFRAPGRFTDRVRLDTDVVREGYKFLFNQSVTHTQTDKQLIEAKTVVVMMNAQGKMYRSVPDVIVERLDPQAVLT